jgi:2-C-methyl-D-erythritol 4-phosphate cytidylyltransferase
MNTAIIVAAGSGKRFGSETPKQFLEVCGRPLIFHTLDQFEACSEIDRIILVISLRETPRFLKIYRQFTYTKVIGFAQGGETRVESVWKGFSSIGDPTEIVVVHDGARPLVTPQEISACVQKARETGAAILTAPVTDTIKEVVDGKIIQTIDRNKLRRALTPQCFRYEILEWAFENVDLSESATDESFLMEKLGIEVSVVEGSARNIKVTTPEDLKLIESFLSEKDV